MSTPTHAEARRLVEHYFAGAGSGCGLLLAYIAAAEQTERELDSWHAEMKEAFGEDWPSDMIDTAAIKRLRRERDELKAKVAHAHRLLGAFPEPSEVPEEPPTYAPDGYAVELERVADALNDRDVDSSELPTCSGAVRAYLGDLSRMTIAYIENAKLAAFLREHGRHLLDAAQANTEFQPCSGCAAALKALAEVIKT